jgi:hypothetical protein
MGRSLTHRAAQCVILWALAAAQPPHGTGRGATPRARITLMEVGIAGTLSESGDLSHAY